MIQSNEWPFPVNVTGDLTRGGPAELVINAYDPLEAELMVTAAVTTFAKLGAVGGLAGAVLPPNESCFALAQDQPVKHANELVWTISSIAIAPQSLTLFLNMLEAIDEGVNMVVVTASGTDSLQKLAVDDFPLATDSRNFVVDSELLGPNVFVEVIFRVAPPESVHERIISAVEAWALAGMTGAFRHADTPAASSFIPPIENEKFLLDALTFSLEGVGAHDAAFDTLINVLNWISINIAEIESVTIES